jgi:hypothetical protein
MYRILASLVLLCTTNLLFGQYNLDNLKITYGEEIKDSKNKIIKIAGEANDKIYALTLKDKSFFLKVFSAGDMKVLSENPIVIPADNDRDVDFEDIYMLNDRLFIIGSVFHKKTKVFTLVGVEVFPNGNLAKNNIVLFDAEVESKSKRGGFYYRMSPDNDALLIMHASNFKKEDAVKYEVKLFDENLNTLFAHSEKVTFEPNKKDHEFFIPDFDVNVNDDVFLVINEGYRDSKTKTKHERFEVHAFKKDKKYAKEVIDINIKDKELINCKMMATANQTLQLVGFYSSVRPNGKANKELKGVYHASLNINNNSVNQLKYNEFDYDTKVKLIGKRRADKGKDVQPLYNIHSIIEKNDGGLIVLSEYQLVMVGQSSGIGPLAFTPVNYIKNEVIVTSLNADGSIAWSNVLPKEQAAAVTVMSFSFGAIGGGGNFTVGGSVSIPLTQMGKGPEYLGLIPMYKNGELDILINDNIKNKGVTDIEKIKSMGNYNNAVPSIFSFDSNGNITRKDPEEAIKNELVLRPGVYYRKSANEFIIYASRKSQNKLGRMVLDK